MLHMYFIIMFNHNQNEFKEYYVIVFLFTEEKNIFFKFNIALEILKPNINDNFFFLLLSSKDDTKEKKKLIRKEREKN